MRMRSIMALLLVAAVLAACGGSQPTATPARPTAMPALPTARPTTATVQATAVPDEIDLGQSSSLDKLDSYRAVYSWKWSETKEGAVTNGFWDALEEYSRADDAQRTLWTTADGTVEVIRIGQYTYIKSDDEEWLAMLSTEGDPLGASAMIGDPLGLIAGDTGKLVQRGVSVNGVTADRYSLAGSSGGFMGLGVAEKMSGDVYVSPQLQVVVKYTAHYEGATLGIEGGTNGVLDVTFDLSDINQPVSILAPEGVEPPLADDIPVMEGATELTAMTGVVSYKTTHTVDEVMAFYQVTMLEKGWLPGEGGIPGMMTYTKEQRQATLMVQGDTGITTVTVVTSD